MRSPAPTGVKLGIFLISVATLLFEVVLTRIFSVVFWYHFAFAAISVGLAGFAISGLVIHRHRDRLHALIEEGALTYGALFFQMGAFIALGFALTAGSGGLMSGPMSLGPVYIASGLPFFASGALVAIILGAWPDEAGRLYAYDLFGAAAGAILALGVLSVMDAPAAVVMSAVVAGGAAVAFSNKETTFTASVAMGASLFLLAIQMAFAPMSVECPKGGCEDGLEAEAWNHFSRVAVFEPQRGARAGISMNYAGPDPISRPMNIDAAAATPILKFDGDLSEVAFLKWDLTSLPYRLRPPKGVFIAGSGGGPDLLAAKVHGAQTITAAEINPLVVRMAQEDFADFSGSPYSLPGVSLELDDARSVMEADSGRYDLILMSLVDTFAASTTGGFALTENHLYTQEAFRLYLEHLSPRGQVAISRWYRPAHPSELLRLAVLARSSLESAPDVTVTDPGAHLLIAAWMGPTPIGDDGQPDASRDWGVGMLMASRSPYTPQERSAFLAACDTMGLRPLWAGAPPDPSSRWNDPNLTAALSTNNLHRFVESYPANVAPPTDDWPFFFQAGRLFDGGAGEYLPGGVRILMMLLFGTGALAFSLVAIGHRQTDGGSTLSRLQSVLAAFGLGAGFIIVEVGLIQRFLLLLGHPTFAMAVVLPALLIGAALGARLTQGLSREGEGRVGALACGAVALLAALAAYLLPDLIAALLGTPKALRVAVSGLMVLGSGVAMGMPFPILLRSSELKDPGVTPFLWAINGAASVFGSVLGMVVAVFGGYALAFMVGSLAYILAGLCLLLRERSPIPLVDSAVALT